MPLIFVLNDKYFVSTITLRSTLVAVGPNLLDYMWYSRHVTVHYWSTQTVSQICGVKTLGHVYLSFLTWFIEKKKELIKCKLIKIEISDP